MNDVDLQQELDAAINQILESASHRKLIVAGPGTGKTTLFRRVLEGGPKLQRLVLTFINNLKAELDAKLGELATVYTFHGYCYALLRRSASLRRGLTEDFQFYPGVASLIKRDWEIFKKERAPHFIGDMRVLKDDESTRFYLDRASYYDAVEYDDSIYRVYQALNAHPDDIRTYELIVVDEFQDFNQLEAAFIELLAVRSPVLIVGDDDQALYSKLRGASYDYIRGLHNSGDYECFELPFCMRCPKAIIDNIDSIIAHAQRDGHLAGRIDKPFRHFPPAKGNDSQKYPAVKRVRASVQTQAMNYFGRYVAEAVDRIIADEVAESWADGFPTALVIGSAPYLGQVADYLRRSDYQLDEKSADDDPDERQEAIRMLHGDPASNLGWRILLDVDRQPHSLGIVRKSVAEGVPLADIIPDAYRDAIVAEAANYVAPEVKAPPEIHYDQARPLVKLTSFEGSKGLSAQHVFIVGMHEGELPRHAANIDDLEICKFIVALTRTRKECHVLWTTRFAGNPKRSSAFLNWLDGEACSDVTVDKDYWAIV
jgi:superfamily I DNA/RNA helicase